MFCKLRTVLHVKVPSVHIIYILHFTHIFIYFTLFRITTRYYMYALPSYCYASSVVLHVTSECGVHVHVHMYTCEDLIGLLLVYVHVLYCKRRPAMEMHHQIFIIFPNSSTRLSCTFGMYKHTKEISS